MSRESDDLLPAPARSACAIGDPRSGSRPPSAPVEHATDRTIELGDEPQNQTGADTNPVQLSMAMLLLHGALALG